MKSIKWWWVGGIGGLVVLLVLLVISWIQTNSLHNDIDDLEAENSSLNSQLTSVQGQLAQAQSSLSSLQSDYDSVSAELADLNSKFPPVEFANSGDLQLWLNGNTVSNQPPATSYEMWYDKALQLQRDALNDGYIISVDIDYYEDSISIWCVAVTDGYMWVWDPETDDIFQDTSIGPLS